jgi:hypothetical protein
VDLQLGTDGDLALEAGDLKLVDGLDAIAQDIQIRLRTFKGGWFLDERVGVPYYEDILVKNPNLAHIRSLYRKAIVETPGVVELLELELALDDANRQLTVSFKALTEAGPLEHTVEMVL